MSFLRKLKNIVAPTVFSIGRVISTAGQVLFGVLNIIKYFTNDKRKDYLAVLDHPATIPTAIISMTANLFINLVTRVPAIFRQFQHPLTEPQKKIDVGNHFDKKLNRKGRMVYLSLSGMCFISGVFVSHNSYLGAITLSEFIAFLAKSDVHDEEWKEYLLQTFAISMAICNLVAYYSWNFQKAKQNARIVAENIDQGIDWRNKTALKTMAVSTLSIASAPLFAYYSEYHALGKTPYLKSSTKAKKILSSISAFTNFTITLLTNVPAVYDNFSRKQNDIYYLDKPRWEPALRSLTYTVAVPETAGNGLGTFVSDLWTCHDVFGIDPYNLYLVVPASVCASSTAFLYFSFAIRQGYNDFVQKDIAKMRRETVYQALSLENPVENVAGPEEAEEEISPRENKYSSRFIV